MRILIAGGDDDCQTVIRGILIWNDYTPIFEANGKRAWERLRREGADMLVTDMAMPEMDGRQLLWHIRSDDRFRDMPVLILAGRASAEDQVQCYEAGADDYLIKPFNTEVFLARIRVLERRILRK